MEQDDEEGGEEVNQRQASKGAGLDKCFRFQFFNQFRTRKPELAKQLFAVAVDSIASRDVDSAFKLRSSLRMSCYQAFSLSSR